MAIIASLLFWENIANSRPNDNGLYLYGEFFIVFKKQKRNYSYYKHSVVVKTLLIDELLTVVRLTDQDEILEFIIQRQELGIY